MILSSDGGIARLRVFGDVVVDPKQLVISAKHIDLAAAQLGGMAIAWSDTHYGMI